MSCEAYRAFVVDSGGKFTRETERARAIPTARELREHALDCAACAELAHEQERLAEVMAALKQGAEATEAKQAEEWTVRVEASLLTSFRQQQARPLAQQQIQIPPAMYAPRAEVTESATAAELSNFSASTSTGFSVVKKSAATTINLTMPQRPSIRKWGALSATVILALGILLNVSRTPSVPPPPRMAHQPIVPQETKPPTPPREPILLGTRNSRSVPRGMLTQDPNLATASSEAAEKTLSVDDLVNAENSENSAGRLDEEIALGGGQNFGPQAGVMSPVGEFIELIPGTQGFLDDGPVVMRVRMPFAAVEYLHATGGMPAVMAPHSSSVGARGFVQADLLVGSDGTARGIRFVP